MITLHHVRSRYAFVVTLILSFVAIMTIGVFHPATAHADQPQSASVQRPTLTVQATVSSEYSPSTGMAGLLPYGAQSAGAGYIFRLDQLDAAKVRRATQAQTTPEARTKRILTNPSAYMMHGADPIFGVTDGSGVVTTDPTGVSGALGIWMTGARYDSANHALAGGRPMEFSGTEDEPTYWLIRLVYAPSNGNKIEPGLVQLPYHGKNGIVWNVTIYPKVIIPPNKPEKPENPGKKPGEKPQPSTPTTPIAQRLRGKLPDTGSVVLMALLLLGILLLLSIIFTLIDKTHRRRHGEQANHTNTRKEQC